MSRAVAEESDVQTSCPSCGVAVVDAILHQEWHEKLARRLAEIMGEASRYKSPPLYG